MSKWSEYDTLMFIWRAIVFLTAMAVFIIASVMVKNNISRKEEYLKDKKSSLKRRWTTTAILYVLGLTIAVLAIWELIKNNPNEWLVFKIVCYVLIWALISFCIMADIEGEKYHWIEIVCGISTVAVPLAMVIAFLTSLYLVNFNHQSAEPAKRIIDSKTIVAIKEESRVNKKTFGSLLFRVSKSSEDVVYEYYYQNEDDEKDWGQIDVKEVTVLPLSEGGEMHLDLVQIGTESTHFRNKRPYQYFQLEETRYELYLPEDFTIE